MRKKLQAIIVVATLLTLSGSAFAGEGWMTDFEKAKKEATKRNVPILADFSGSDWCGWCVKLDKEVFSKKKFKDYAKDNFVLLLLDFPRGKKQSPALKRQNQELAKKYGIRGFPTVLILDKDGKKIAKTGYVRGGPDAYIEKLKTLLKSK